jgi:hypothetical protein
MIRDTITIERRKELKDELSRLWELHASETRDAGYGGMSNEESLPSTSAAIACKRF